MGILKRIYEFAGREEIVRGKILGLTRLVVNFEKGAREFSVLTIDFPEEEREFLFSGKLNSEYIGRFVILTNCRGSFFSISIQQIIETPSGNRTTATDNSSENYLVEAVSCSRRDYKRAELFLKDERTVLVF